MTSAAYGFGHHSIADVTAVGARCRPSSHRRLSWEVCLVKRGRTRHARLGIFCTLDSVRRRWLFRLPSRPRTQPTQTLTNKSTLSPTGVRGQAFFTGQSSRRRCQCEECLTGLPSAPPSGACKGALGFLGGRGSLRVRKLRPRRGTACRARYPTAETLSHPAVGRSHTRTPMSTVGCNICFHQIFRPKHGRVS